jgi:hypothetical protein
MPAGFGEPAIRFAKRVLHEAVADGAAVEEKILMFGDGAGQFGQPDDTGESDLGIAASMGSPRIGEFIGPGSEPAAFGILFGKVEDGAVLS